MNMNNSVDPCDDFYQFACGGWEKRHTIYDGMNGVFHDDIRNAKTQKLVIQLLREKSSPNELPSLRRTKDWFKSCEDQAAINARGAQPFKDWLSTTFGGWPLLHYNTDYASINLTELVVKAYRNSFENLFEFKVRLKVTNDSRDAIEIDFPTNYGMRGLQEIPRNLTDVNNYTTYIYNVTKLLGLADPSTALSDAADIVDFELELSKITPQPQLIGDVSTLSEVDELYSTSKFNFGVFFKMMLATPGVDITDVNESEPIYVGDPAYFQRFRDLINNTPMKTIVNFIMWRVTLEYVGTLPKVYRDLEFEYKKVTTGISTVERRDDYCARIISSNDKYAVAKLFVDRYGDKEALKYVNVLQDQLEEAFSEFLEELDWMSNSTKANADEKNRFIARKIGWPDIIDNEKALRKYYEKFEFESGKYFENIVIQHQQIEIERLKSLRTSDDRLAWFFPALFLSIVAARERNDITIPVALLQRPSFSLDYPQYINYGAIGVSSGVSRLLHFDHFGFKRNKYGSQQNWITLKGNDSDWKGYLNISDCVIKHYDEFVIEGFHNKTIGIMSLDVNVADIGGFKLGFRAYKNWVKDQGKKEPLLPGLNYSQDQLFFIQAAQSKCGKQTPLSFLTTYRKYPHFPPGKIRVNGALRNNKEFSEVFNCPSTSYMNPPDKCTVY
jgi:membrane metallo-endopeptidase-like protein 1